MLPTAWLIGGSGASGSAELASWDVGGLQAGRSVAPSPLVEDAARRSDVEPAGIKELARAGTGRTRYGILQARSRTGDICFAPAAEGVGAPFQCLTELVSASDRALVVFFRSGGSNLAVLEDATLAGVARSDVTRVVVSLKSGSEIDLTLNDSRAFSYLATTAEAIPRAVTAYRGSEQAERVGLYASAPDAR